MRELLSIGNVNQGEQSQITAVSWAYGGGAVRVPSPRFFGPGSMGVLIASVVGGRVSLVTTR